MHSSAEREFTRYQLLGLVSVLIGLTMNFLSPVAHALTLGLPDNTTQNLFLDTDDPDTLPNFQGILTTGVGVVTGFQLQIGNSFFNHTAPSNSTDDFVLLNMPSIFLIIDNTAPGTGGLFTLLDSGVWASFWLSQAVINGCIKGCTWAGITAVPETSSFILALIGLGALAGVSLIFNDSK
jgi:hypothetical protein